MFRYSAKVHVASLCRNKIVKFNKLPGLHTSRATIKQYSSAIVPSTSSSVDIKYSPSNLTRLCGQAVRRPIYLQIAKVHVSPILKNELIDVLGPSFAESITEGDIRWLKNKGDAVKADEVVAHIETDKTMVDVPAPQDGYIVEIVAPEGSKVVAKQKLFVMKAGEGGQPAATAAPTVSTPEPSPSEEVVTEQPRQLRQESIQPPQPFRTTPVSEFQPVAAASLSPRTAPPQAYGLPPATSPIQSVEHVAPPAHVSAEKAITGSRTETCVKMNRMRQRIAQRLKDAQNTYAMLTTFNEIDMSNILALRAKYKESFAKKHGVKLGIMSPFIKAAAYALLDQSVVNAAIDEGEIVYRHYIDMSVAVATERGLVVPVLRNVEHMSYAGIELAIAQLGEKARDNKLAIEDMESGTFTVSNGGVFGSLLGTPIINPPQSAILGMHATNERPVAINGKVEIRPIMYVALTYDHRLIDGREAVTFLRKIKQAVEDPASILLNL